MNRSLQTLFCTCVPGVVAGCPIHGPLGWGNRRRREFGQPSLNSDARRGAYREYEAIEEMPRLRRTLLLARHGVGLLTQVVRKRVDVGAVRARGGMGCTWGLHSWRGGKRTNTRPEPFSLAPVVGSRVCARCGKRQQFLWDSQGGAWETVR